MLETERRVALEVIHQATRISRAVQSELTLGQWSKEDRTPITVADLAVQSLVSGVLKQAFPDDPFMAEEGTEELRDAANSDLLRRVGTQVRSVANQDVSDNTLIDWIGRGQDAFDPHHRYWVLDPIDGTKGFLRREQYAIALALIERGEILLGVLACPNMPESLGDPRSAGSGDHSKNDCGEIYVAVRGEGATRYTCPLNGPLCNARPARVTSNVDPQRIQWCDRVETSDANHDLMTQIVRTAGITLPAHRLDSQAKYAVVSRGESDLYVRYSIKPYIEKVWDHAAGVIVIEEAGGKVTDIHGRPLDFSLGRELSKNRGILATNSHCHEVIAAAAKQCLPVG